MQDNTELINSIKLNGSVPENTNQWGDPNILLLATEIMNEILLPGILAIKKDYFVFGYETPMIQNKASYRIHERAAFGLLRDVYRFTGVDSRNVPIPQMDKKDAWQRTSGIPSAFYAESNSIVIYPAPASADWTLGMPFYMRPSKLLQVPLASKITAINLLTKTVTIDAFPSVPFAVGAKMDFVKGTPGYEITSIDNVILSRDTSPMVLTVTFSGDLPTTLEIGDWLTPARWSPVPNVPEEFHSIVALAAASRILGSMGQLDQQKAVDNTIQMHMNAMKFSMVPRVSGQPQRFTTQLL